MDPFLKVVQGFNRERIEYVILSKGNTKKLKKLARTLQTLRAISPEYMQMDLCLSVTGYTYEQLSQDASLFRAGQIRARVAKLSKLLKMKELADRPKDRLFLERFKLKQK